MNTIRRISPLAMALAASLSLAAAARAEDSSGRNDNQNSGITALQNQERGRPLGDVLGKSVRTSSGNEVGNVKDLVIDSGSGEIRFVLVSSGGLLGVADTVRPIPASAIQMTGEDAYRVSVDDAKWQSAPTIRDNELHTLTKDQRGGEVFQHYGQQWKSASASGTDAMFAYARELKGRDVNNGTGKVGEIDDLIVNLKQARASLVLDPEENVLENNSKFVVSFDKVSSAAIGDITTTLTRTDFENARPLTDNDWTGPTFVGIYTWTVPMTTSGGAGYAATANRDPDTRIGNERKDANAPIDAVRNAIQNDDSLKASAENVNVLAQNGQLILRGTVNSEDTKERIEDKAENAAKGWPVDNQITIATSE